MKNFTLILSAVMLASSAFAAPAFKANPVSRDAFKGKKGQLTELSLDKAKTLKAPMVAVKPTSDNIIEPLWEAEEGEQVIMNINYSSNVQGEVAIDDNAPAQIIYAANNTVYIGIFG